MTLYLLGISILLSTGRNLFSKRLSNTRFGTDSFFLCQSILFLFGGISLLLFGSISWNAVAAQTWLYALLYDLRTMVLYGGTLCGKHGIMLHGIFHGLHFPHTFGSDFLVGVLRGF